MRYIKIIMLFLILSAVLVACGGTTMPVVNEGDVLATMVAATVQAALGEPPAEVQSAATPVPDSPTPDDLVPDPAPIEAVSPTLAPPPPAAPAALSVAYIKDGDVYVWVEGGSSMALTNVDDVVDVSISSDGQVIAYVRDAPFDPYTYELWAVNTSIPTNERLLVSYPEMDALKASSSFPDAAGLDFDQLAWRPGTHDLYYSTVPRFEGPGYVPLYDLRMVNADTLVKATLFNFGQAGAFTFSPDGAQVVLSTPDHISLANADGSNLRSHVLTYPLVGTYSEYQYHPSPIWAADSLSLRVAIPPEDTLAEPTPPTSLWYIPVDGTPATQLGSMNSIPFDWPNNAFSPDMSYVAYIKSVGDPVNNERELHISYADGSNDYIFNAGTTLQFHSWAPDATRFLYASNAAADPGLYLGSLNGSIFLISSEHQTMRQIEWVDNSRIIFIYDYNSAIELRITAQDGTNHALIDTLTNSFYSYDFTQ